MAVAIAKAAAADSVVVVADTEATVSAIAAAGVVTLLGKKIPHYK